MATKLLAQQLGLVEVVEVTRKRTGRFSIQPFDYLLIMDFESTCWDRTEPVKGLPEIIEFPCVLFDVKTCKVIEEYQQYVMPLENPKLSNFCIELTGIKQTQVDNGIPLQTCLMTFKKWLLEIARKHNFSMPPLYEKGSKKSAFATWSDWDFGTCLNNECRRKRITYPEYFSTWIDLRALYREHYNRRPKGLRGALTEVGLDFQGREHSGLEDARNTASLAGRMISEGVLLRITK